MTTDPATSRPASRPTAVAATARATSAAALRSHEHTSQRMPDDLHLAGPATGVREFACLSCVTSLRPGDGRLLRRIVGVTGVIADDDAADVHLIVTAPSRRGAEREAALRIAAALPHAVVTVPQVVDYDAALLCHLELQGCDFDDWAIFDDGVAVAGALDRR